MQHGPAHSTPPAAPEPLEVLESGQRALARLFADYAELARQRASSERRRALAQRICTELAIHVRLEEEWVYPALRDAGVDAALLQSCARSQEALRELMAQILAMRRNDEAYDARVAALRDCVQRHAAHARTCVWPALVRSGADLRALGRRLAERKAELAAVEEALLEEALASALS
jgi:uncharacterized protein YhaN